MKKRVIVAMSGGVDSSVTALLLKELGYEVIGITMQIWPSNKVAEEAGRFGGCCSLSAVRDAQKVAWKIGIPHYVVNFREVFKKGVINYFIKEYQEGRTPNPCIKCNQLIKFDALLKKAQELGGSFIATGHYARIEFDSENKRYLLKRGVDVQKDQSYVLYPMTQEQLAHTLMPLGNLRKDEVREIARKEKLAVAEKKESQEICFIPDNDYGKFLKEVLPEAARPGDILNEKGEVIGKHKGIIFYTVGQRKGLGISAPRPLYVLSIDKEKNTLIVGSKEKVFEKELVAQEVNLISLDKLEKPIKVTAKIRYQSKEARATVFPLKKGEVRVVFDQPQPAITPGQSVVFYQGNLVVGGGIIKSTLRPPPYS